MVLVVEIVETQNIQKQRMGKQSISKLIYKQINHCLTQSGKWEAEAFDKKKGRKSEEE